MERPTNATPPSAPKLPRGAVAGALGLATAGLVAYNVHRIQRLRRLGPTIRVDLDHDRTVGEGIGAPLELTVLGDSAADGFGLNHPQHAYPFHVASHLSTATGRRVRVRSMARDGAGVSDVLAEQLPLLPAMRPDAVVVSVGVNDAVRRRSLEEISTDTTSVLERLTEIVPKADVVLVGCPDLSVAPAVPWPTSRLLGRRCRQVAAVQQTVAAACEVPFADLSDTEPEMFGEDGFHPSAAGQAAAARATVSALVGASPERLTPKRRPWRRPWISHSKAVRTS